MNKLIAIICLLLSGCSTMATIAGGSNAAKFSCDDQFAITRIYSGISNDLKFLRGDYQDKGFIFWDLPFSLIADTVVLPYTIYTQTRYGNICDKDDKAHSQSQNPSQPLEPIR
jgi:uncharacterized protein YceK